MGLDMYLTRQTYVKNWDHTSNEKKHQISIKRGGINRTDIKPERICEIVEEVGYWRKANQIHKWFVDECQNGVDDCQNAYVEESQLALLLETCKTIVKALEGKEMIDKEVKSGWANGKNTYATIKVYKKSDIKLIKELLPTRSGFFFGSDDYDEGYLDDIKDTIDIIEPLLKESNQGDYHYHSSW